MRGWIALALGVVGSAFAAGCYAPTRVATRVTEVPRVDLDLSGGNRGYLLGAPPPAVREQSATRQMIETNIEIPSLYKPKYTGTKVRLDEGVPPAVESEAGVSVSATTPTHYDTYVVQKGESLWTIAKKPEIYGRVTAWRKIFDANRDILKSPNSVRPGMKLKIPRGQTSKGDSTTSEDEGTAFKK